MKGAPSPYRELETRLREAESLIHALRTQQVDAIVGERHIMLVRLKLAEDELERSRDELRSLAGHLLSARDAERIAIARELHDEFGQALTGLQLGLSWLSLNVPTGHRPLRTKIMSLARTTTSLIRSLKDITIQLRPGALDEVGLCKTLQSTAKGFKAYAGTPCRFRTNAARAAFDRTAAIAVFRIVQAGLTNVARHAHASLVMLALMKSKTELIVTVRDNGKGIRPAEINSKNSLGLIGMRERALALGGTFAIAGAKGEGTLLTVRIPLARAFGTARP
jgi:signal transduction histidine kinase